MIIIFNNDKVTLKEQIGTDGNLHVLTLGGSDTTVQVEDTLNNSVSKGASYTILGKLIYSDGGDDSLKLNSTGLRNIAMKYMTFLDMRPLANDAFWQYVRRVGKPWMTVTRNGNDIRALSNIPPECSDDAFNTHELPDDIVKRLVNHESVHYDKNGNMLVSGSYVIFGGKRDSIPLVRNSNAGLSISGGVLQKEIEVGSHSQTTPFIVKGNSIKVFPFAINGDGITYDQLWISNQTVGTYFSVLNNQIYKIAAIYADNRRKSYYPLPDRPLSISNQTAHESKLRCTFNENHFSNGVLSVDPTRNGVAIGVYRKRNASVITPAEVINLQNELTREPNMFPTLLGYIDDLFTNHNGILKLATVEDINSYTVTCHYRNPDACTGVVAFRREGDRFLEVRADGSVSDVQPGAGLLSSLISALTNTPPVERFFRRFDPAAQRLIFSDDTFITTKCDAVHSSDAPPCNEIVRFSSEEDRTLLAHTRDGRIIREPQLRDLINSLLQVLIGDASVELDMTDYFIPDERNLSRNVFKMNRAKVGLVGNSDNGITPPSPGQHHGTVQNGSDWIVPFFAGVLGSVASYENQSVATDVIVNIPDDHPKREIITIAEFQKPPSSPTIDGGGVNHEDVSQIINV